MIFGNFTEWTVQNILIRIIVSSILGFIIGFDREMKHRAAGTKTITVVCLGATLVMLTEQYIQINFPGLANMTRMAAQVISGVGFLGVGTIIISNHKVRGLTTAATLWASACVGLAVGIGFLDGGILISLMVLIALHFSPFIEKHLSKTTHYFNLIVDIDKPHSLHAVIQEIKSCEITIESFEIMKPRYKGEPMSVYMVLHSRHPMDNSTVYDLITQSDNVISVDFI